MMGGSFGATSGTCIGHLIWVHSAAHVYVLCTAIKTTTCDGRLCKGTTIVGSRARFRSAIGGKRGRGSSTTVAAARPNSTRVVEKRLRSERYNKEERYGNLCPASGEFKKIFHAALRELDMGNSIFDALSTLLGGKASVIIEEEWSREWVGWEELFNVAAKERAQGDAESVVAIVLDATPAMLQRFLLLAGANVRVPSLTDSARILELASAG